jgi:predicted GNAT family acetyltransferase
VKIIKYESIQYFLENNQSYLLIKESFHNLILGLANNVLDQKAEVNELLLWGIQDKAGVLVACAVRIHVDRPLIVTEMSEEAVDLLIANLITKKIHLKGIVGEENTATYFKKQWTLKTKLNFKVYMHMGIYECSRVIFPKVNLGAIFVAQKIHAGLASEFITGFMRECMPKEYSEQHCENVLRRLLDNKNLYLYTNEFDEIVSMAANTRSTTNAATLSLVYTPEDLRGKGYASNTVALLTDKLIKNGKKFTNLYTDLSNPTSNSIYQKVGYVKIGQNIHFEFIEQ